MRIDHDLLQKSEKYRVAIRRRLAEHWRSRGEVAVLNVEHEPDFACCRIEPWSVTMQKLFGFVAPSWSRTDGDPGAQTRWNRPMKQEAK